MIQRGGALWFLKLPFLSRLSKNGKFCGTFSYHSTAAKGEGGLETKKSPVSATSTILLNFFFWVSILWLQAFKNFMAQA